MQQLKIENYELNHFIKFIGQLGLSIEHSPNDNKIVVMNSEFEKVALLRYGIYQEFDGQSFQSREFINHAIIGVRAGLAGLHCYENGVLIDHKVFRAYMVRKKQGKSQIKYLKTKGKSRAGSRVRLGETKLFFEQIAERFEEYDARIRLDKIYISCSKTLIPYLFSTNGVLQKYKSLKRIIKVPFHIQQPTHKSLLLAQQQLGFNQVLIKENQLFDSQSLKDYLSVSEDFSSNQDDW